MCYACVSECVFVCADAPNEHCHTLITIDDKLSLGSVCVTCVCMLRVRVHVCVCMDASNIGVCPCVYTVSLVCVMSVCTHMYVCECEWTCVDASYEHYRTLITIDSELSVCPVCALRGCTYRCIQ